MTYGYENETGAEFDFDAESLYRTVVDAVLDEEECPYESEVNLLITDNASIKEINREQRDIDAPTDVLSFPMVQYDVPGDFSAVDETEDCFNIETGELLLGDIVISADRIRSQAEEYGHSERREYAFLIVHSMLHLIGYDHIADEDRRIMEEKQRVIMDILGITR
ncbi:MAG: rRNA maturation RNase YbeY [Lachnospiraceae bacterium]|jgi:probable rRNA maturation factor|nr:rRNA maturation RNase YbeY [Lachnospiraceae bacterium]